MKKIIFFALAFCFFKLSFSQNWSIVLNFDNGRYGVIDLEGRRLVPTIYLSIDVIDSTFAVVTDSLYKKGVVNNQGNIVVPCKYDNIEKFFTFKSNYFIYNKNELFRVHNFNKVGVYKIGKGEIIPCKYDDVGFFNYQNTISNVFSLNIVIGVCHPQFNVVDAKINENWGIVDSLFNLVIPFEYQQFGTSFREIILAKKNNKWGILSLASKKEMTEFKYDTIYTPILFDQLTQNYIYTVQMNDSVFVINSQGLKYFIPKNISQDFNLINPEYGYLNNAEGEFIDLYFYKQNLRLKTNYFPYDGFALWENSTIFSAHKNKFIIVKSDGKEVFKLKKNMVDNYYDEFIIGNKFFFDGSKIYEKTKEGVVEKFDVVINKSENLDNYIYTYPLLMVVKHDDKFGVVYKDKYTVKEVLPCEYDKISYADSYYEWGESPLLIEKNKTFGMIFLDKGKLKWSIPLEYEKIETFDSPLYFVKKNGKYGIYMIDFGLRVKCDYTSKDAASKAMLIEE